MIQTLVATLMWALVASLLIVRRKRADRSITYASTTIAIAMTLNVDAVYAAVDPVLGGTNIATLIADAAVVCAEAFVRLASRTDGRALMGQVGKIGFAEGQRPAVTLVNGVMTITVAPSLGMAGRPSSDRIIFTVMRARIAPPRR